MPLPDLPEQLRGDGQPDGDVASLIRQLYNPDPSVRRRAAHAIFSQGRDCALASVPAWLVDPELAAYFVVDGSGSPQTTVGIAVDPEEFEKIRAAHGNPSLARVPPDMNIREFEIHRSGGVRLDILTTGDASREGPIGRFLAKFGPGIQQVEFDVHSVQKATDRLREQFGMSPTYEEARQGANGTLVNFFLVPAGDAGKLLIELVESPGSTA
jgi:hypothetical protein